jgi:hypothetical protein
LEKLPGQVFQKGDSTMSAKHTKSIRVVSNEQQEQPTAEYKRWVDELLEQKRYIAQLQAELDQLRDNVKEKKEWLKSAEARLFALIEEAGQQYLPFNDATPSEATQESVDA